MNKNIDMRTKNYSTLIMSKYIYMCKLKKKKSIPVLIYKLKYRHMNKYKTVQTISTFIQQRS